MLTNDCWSIDNCIHLRIASGVLHKLNSILPVWMASRSTKRPPELNEKMSQALAVYLNAAAQKMSVVKAMQKEGGTSPLLLSKLCIMVI